MPTDKLIGGNRITDADPLQVVATGVLPASGTAADIADGTAALVVPATFAAGSAPTVATNGYRINRRGYGGRVRTLIDYTGSVTACNVRLYTREPGGTAWYRGISTDESGYPLTPASGDESRDWDIGEGVEFLFVVESISPGTSGNTVAIKAAGVAR